MRPPFSKAYNCPPPPSRILRLVRCAPVRQEGEAMQLNRFAYCGNGAPAATRPRLSPFRGNGRWETLDADTLAEVCVHLDDRQLAQLSNVDRRMLKLARIAIQRHLGLSASQWAVFDAVLHRRENVLLMGAPGTGKSFLLKILRERVRNPLVTASTAAAADKIGAITLHSALSLGLGDRPVEEIMKRLKRPHNAHGQETINTVMNCTTLIHRRGVHADCQAPPPRGRGAAQGARPAAAACRQWRSDAARRCGRRPRGIVLRRGARAAPAALCAARGAPADRRLGVSPDLKRSAHGSRTRG